MLQINQSMSGPPCRHLGVEEFGAWRCTCMFWRPCVKSLTLLYSHRHDWLDCKCTLQLEYKYNMRPLLIVRYLLIPCFEPRELVLAFGSHARHSQPSQTFNTYIYACLVSTMSAFVPGPAPILNLILPSRDAQIMVLLCMQESSPTSLPIRQWNYRIVPCRPSSGGRGNNK